MLSLKKCSDEHYQLKNKNAPFEKLWFSFFEEQISQYQELWWNLQMSALQNLIHYFSFTWKFGQ